MFTTVRNGLQVCGGAYVFLSGKYGQVVSYGEGSAITFIARSHAKWMRAVMSR